MVYEAVAGTVQEFIDYALIAVTLMIIYFVFKLFTIDGPTKEEKKRMEEERINAGREWLKGKWDKYKENEKNKAEAEKKRQEQSKRAGILNGAKGFTIEAEELAEETQDVLRTKSAAALTKAKSNFKSMSEKIVNVKKIVKAAKHQSKGEVSNKLEQIGNYVASIKSHLDDAENNLPKDEKEPNWDTKVTDIRTKLGMIKGGCGKLIRDLDKFIDEG